MSKTARVLVVGIALALLCALMVALGMHSGGRGALRTYLAGLQAKGEKLTHADLMRGRITNFFDSHAVITNAKARIEDGLHPVAPGFLELRRYVAPGQAIVACLQTNPLWTGPASSGEGPTWEDLDANIRANQAILQQVRDALKTPALDAGPYTNVFTARRVEFVAIRTVAQWLMAAAENDLHAGRLEQALQNIEALAGLAFMERDEPTLVAQMIRISVANLGLTLTWEALQAPGWAEPQLERLQKAWAQVDLLDAAERGLMGERAGGYEIFDMVRHSSGARMAWLFGWKQNAAPLISRVRLEEIMTEWVHLPVYKLTSIDQDELFYLRNLEEGITATRLLRAHHPWSEAKQRVVRASTNINAIAGSPQKLRYLISLMALPNYWRACETAVHAETERQMTLAAIAVKRYQLCHGQAPASLDALVPAFLTVPPFDFMDGQPLRYRLQPDGSYILYSVGDDGKDDGGDATPLPGGRAGLWSGQDAVWTSATRAARQAVP